MSGWLGVLAWALAASALHLRGRRRHVLAARLGHEVRGPLCTAQLALEGLERCARVEAIGLELRRAALALDDLTAGRRRSTFRRAPHPAGFEPVDLGRLLVVAAEGWRALADAHGVGLAVQPGRAIVAGDPLCLAQALANLVANAIEHGGRHVRVASSAADGRARIEVADLGRGLPAPLDKLIAAARGRRTARGHGLAIAAAVAKRHGGTLTAIPVPRGAHLVLDLPEATAPPRRAISSPPPGQPASSPPIRLLRRAISSPPAGQPASPRPPHQIS